MDQGERPNLSRRGFLGLLAGLAATPIIKPKKSFFFFEAPKKIIEPQDVSFDIQKAIAALPPRGGTVLIPAGSWVLNQGILIPQNVSLVAEGNVNIVGCRFESAPDLEGPMLAAKGNIDIGSCHFKAAPGRKGPMLTVEDGNALITGCVFDGGDILFEVPKAG